MEDKKHNSENFDIEYLKVSADKEGVEPEERKRNVKNLAGAISHALRTNGEISVRCFGNDSIGKAAKALSIAREYINQTDEIRLSFSPAFIESEVGDKTLTGINFCTFTTENSEGKDLDNVKSTLIVKADEKDIDASERKTKVRKLAGAISHSVEENGECIVKCFGNRAIGKAAKALAIARGFTATRGPDLYCWATFIISRLDDGTDLTGIAFLAYSNE